MAESGSRRTGSQKGYPEVRQVRWEARGPTAGGGEPSCGRVKRGLGPFPSLHLLSSLPLAQSRGAGRAVRPRNPGTGACLLVVAPLASTAPTPPPPPPPAGTDRAEAALWGRYRMGRGAAPALSPRASRTQRWALRSHRPGPAHSPRGSPLKPLAHVGFGVGS